MKRVILLDLDDGPEGGGAVALGRVLRAAGIAHESLALEAVASGWEQLERGGPVRLVDHDQLAARIAVLEERDEQLWPCSRRACHVLDELADRGLALPDRLEELLDGLGLHAELATAPLEEVEDEDEDEGPPAGSLALLPHALVVAPPADEVPSFGRGASWIITSMGRLVDTEDAGDCWFRLRELGRRGELASRVFPKAKRMLYAMALFVHEGEIRARATLRLDAVRPNWRPALGRSVDGPAWAAAAEALLRVGLGEGLHQVLWARGRDEDRPALMALRPLPAPWLDLATEEFAAAFRGEQGGVLPAGRIHADAPVDLLVTPKELAERNRLR